MGYHKDIKVIAHAYVKKDFKGYIVNKLYQLNALMDQMGKYVKMEVIQKDFQIIVIVIAPKDLLVNFVKIQQHV